MAFKLVRDAKKWSAYETAGDGALTAEAAEAKIRELQREELKGAEFALEAAKKRVEKKRNALLEPIRIDRLVQSTVTPVDVGQKEDLF